MDKTIVISNNIPMVTLGILLLFSLLGTFFIVLFVIATANQPLVHNTHLVHGTLPPSAVISNGALWPGPNCEGSA